MKTRSVQVGIKTHRVAHAEEAVVVDNALGHAGHNRRGHYCRVQAGDDGRGNHGGRRHNGNGQSLLLLGRLLGRARHGG